MPALVAGIHVLLYDNAKAGMAGTSPAMTKVVFGHTPSFSRSLRTRSLGAVPPSNNEGRAGGPSLPRRKARELSEAMVQGASGAFSPDLPHAVFLGLLMGDLGWLPHPPRWHD